MTQDSLHILVPQELFATAESSLYTGILDVAELAYGPDIYHFAQPLQWAITLTNTGDAILVAGTVRGTGTTACGRCLEDVAIEVDGEVEGYYLLHEPEDEGEEEVDDDFDILPEDNIIDLEPLILGAVLVDLPTMPLCKEDCKGLCPDCGTNLNEGECGCAETRAAEQAAFDEAKNPFAKLRELNLGEVDSHE